MGVYLAGHTCLMEKCGQPAVVDFGGVPLCASCWEYFNEPTTIEPPEESFISETTT